MVEKIADWLGQLSLDEKLHLLHGGFSSGGVPRLGIPPLTCADGPVGVRLASPPETGGTGGDDEVQNEGLAETVLVPTAFSSTIGLAATFDTDAAEAYGRLLGREARAAGIQVMFGPGINLMRDPRCGRNFEYMGEDPRLTSLIAGAYIRGMQAEGVGACAKHYYANDLESPRHQTSSNLDAATAWELHLRPFAEACQRDGVWTIMTGNNLVNGTHISENRRELHDVLRTRLGWDGVVLTDWRAAYTPEGAVTGGTDMTTGFCSYVYGDGDLRALIENGTVGVDEIDAMVAHVLLLYARTGLLDETRRAAAMVDTERHRAPARRLAAASMVLLKNEGAVLPLAGDRGRIAVTGPGADTVAAGGGSSLVTGGFPPVSIREGLRQVYGERVTAEVESAAVAVYCAVAPGCGEGADMETIRLDAAQEQEILALARTCPRVAVVLQCGTAVEMGVWAQVPQAILVAWFGGQELGHAVADILSGAVNPSGKLPCTFGRSIQDYPCEALGLWPRRLILETDPPPPGHSKTERRILHAYDADYKEGLLIGYRWFDKQGIEPLFPFGHGLSYTSFTFSDAAVTLDGGTIRVRCRAENTGAVAGTETVQVYTGAAAPDERTPVRELKAFEKVRLEPGESREVEINLGLDALARYDARRDAFVAAPGDYVVAAGTSSRNLFMSVISHQ